MRILVCADLHAGARTWGVDRKEEILFALSQIYDVAMDFDIGALFVLGDVFHSFRYPGEDIVTPVAEFFSKILNLNSKPFVYMLKGNHDWSGIKVWELFQDDGRFIFVDEVTFLRLDDFMVFLVPYLRKHFTKGERIKRIPRITMGFSARRRGSSVFRPYGVRRDCPGSFGSYSSRGYFERLKGR